MQRVSLISAVWRWKEGRQLAAHRWERAPLLWQLLLLRRGARVHVFVMHALAVASWRRNRAAGAGVVV